jgi:hypothetical protein
MKNLILKIWKFICLLFKNKTGQNEPLTDTEDNYKRVPPKAKYFRHNTNLYRK